MSARLQERQFEAQAAALGLTPERLIVVTEIAFVGWSVRRPWSWLSPNAQRWLFVKLGGASVRREIERDLRGDHG